MNKDRVEGCVKTIKGVLKQAVGKTVGDTKLSREGKVDEIEGKAQNALGGIKDEIKGA